MRDDLDVHIYSCTRVCVYACMRCSRVCACAAWAACTHVCVGMGVDTALRHINQIHLFTHHTSSIINTMQPKHTNTTYNSDKF